MFDPLFYASRLFRRDLHIDSYVGLGWFGLLPNTRQGILTSANITVATFLLRGKSFGMLAGVKPQSYLTSEVAMLASLVLHVLVFMAWQNRTVIERLPFFRPLAKVLVGAPHRQPTVPVTPTITFVQEPAPQRVVERRQQFIETDASQVTGEEPKNARFYSANSTVAANPENPSGKTGDTPYLDGKETRLASTENVHPLPPGAPAAPAPKPVEAPAVKPQPTAPKPAEPVKDLPETGIKVVEEKKLAMLEQPAESPRRIRQRPAPAGSGSSRDIATAKSHATAMGVSRIGIAAFNVAGSPFGEYDKALIFAVQSRWYAVLNEKRMDVHAGTVVLKFDLRADGSVANMQVVENNAGFDLGLYCQKAVVESAPFAPLPESLQRLIGSDAREIVFTFYY